MVADAKNACEANETRQWRTKVECSSTAAHEVLFGEPAFHMRVLPPGTLCPTTSAPWLILSSSENCSNRTILVKLLIFVDFVFFSVF